MQAKTDQARKMMQMQAKKDVGTQNDVNASKNGCRYAKQCKCKRYALFCVPASVSFAYRLHLPHFVCQHLFYFHIACICIVLRAHFVLFTYHLHLHCFACRICFLLHIACLCTVLHARLHFPLHVACIALFASLFCFIACICIRTMMLTA